MLLRSAFPDADHAIACHDNMIEDLDSKKFASFLKSLRHRKVFATWCRIAGRVIVGKYDGAG